jgi:hypothetical protein
VSAATDALREALEALDIDAVETEMDELRSALDAARAALQDAATEVRTALAKVQEVAAEVRKLSALDAEEIDASEVHAALDTLGGPDSTLYGPIEDLDSAADSLDSAVDDITSALGDGEEQQPPAGCSPTACLHQAPAGEEEPPEGAVCMCAACQAARAQGRVA